MCFFFLYSDPNTPAGLLGFLSNQWPCCGDLRGLRLGLGVALRGDLLLRRGDGVVGVLDELLVPCFSRPYARVQSQSALALSAMQND